jgi:hypothetical protein
MHFANSLQRDVLVAPNIISSVYICTINMSLPFSLCGEGGVNFANVETIFDKKSL